MFTPLPDAGVMPSAPDAVMRDGVESDVATATVPVKFTAEEMVCPLISPEVMVPEPKAREVPVIAPAPSVPVVERFSLPKDIAPLESVILPFASVRLPMVEPDAAVMVEVNLPVPATSSLYAGAVVPIPTLFVE